MNTESTRLPQTRPITGPTQDSSAYYNRESEFDASVEMVTPVMTNLGELLEAIFLNNVDLIMGFVYWRIYEGQTDSAENSRERFIEFFSDESVNNCSWREQLDRSDVLLDVPLVIGVRQLFAYAYHGSGPSNVHYLFDETVKNEEYIRKLLETTKAAVATLGLGNPATRRLSTVLLAAECRLALDEGRNVTPEQLAALVRIGIKSMRNALAPSGGSGLKMRDGAIPAESALNWLHARGDYKTTLWLEEESSIAPVAEPLAGEILFVPFASDDIEFHPLTCRRDGKYTVGPKGAEQTFTDYRAALDCLARMKPASYWRHPNTANNWGTVTAIGFRPRTVEELALKPAEGGEK